MLVDLQAQEAVDVIHHSCLQKILWLWGPNSITAVYMDWTLWVRVLEGFEGKNRRFWT